MGNSKEEIFINSPILQLKSIFLKKGYPENSFKETQHFRFSYKDLKFNFEIPLIIEKDSQVLFIVDYKPQKKLTVSERGFIALARIFFTPLPYFGVITNFQEFILINFYTAKIQKGNEDIIPDFTFFENYKPEELKPFKPEIEKRILAIYLSGG